MEIEMKTETETKAETETEVPRKLESRDSSGANVSSSSTDEPPGGLLCSVATQSIVRCGDLRALIAERHGVLGDLEVSLAVLAHDAIALQSGQDAWQVQTQHWTHCIIIRR
eukprot:TRINITY_DN3535_c0_g1_i1.p2 TRINITY_DN3535_c0_g1~~TRINITY_DN3535_c0_g1_i1.p2  ORF type:complete len:111 (-),score=5.56 TRINITY_DN3535_c0_g1_i1:49-381(-)